MPKTLKIKVCGMKNRLNIHELQSLSIQYMGLIFFPTSKRFVDKSFEELELAKMPKHIKLTGVFVNETLEKVIEKVHEYHLKAVQLHGQESAMYCNALKEHFADIQIIKAFGIDMEFNFSVLKPYQESIDYFLFDTKTIAHGGSGQKFDWQLLSEYNLPVPFFLSGGLSLEDIEEIHNFEHPQMVGLDLNSRFEITPGLKNIVMVKQFLNELTKD